jgi:hypothetical protein
VLVGEDFPSRHSHRPASLLRRRVVNRKDRKERLVGLRTRAQKPWSARPCAPARRGRPRAGQSSASTRHGLPATRGARLIKPPEPPDARTLVGPGYGDGSSLRFDKPPVPHRHFFMGHSAVLLRSACP